MSSATYACFRCRLISRRVKIDLPRINMGAWSDVRCAKCRQSCNYIGQKLDYPKNSDAASWRALEDRVQADRLSDGLPPVDVLARTHASPLPRKVGGRSKARAAKVKVKVKVGKARKVKAAKVKRGGRGGRPKAPAARRPAVKKKVAKKLKKTPARSAARKPAAVRKSAAIKSRSSKRVLAKRKGTRRTAGKRRS